MNKLREGDIVTVKAKVLRFYDNGNVRLDFGGCEGENLLGLGQMNLPKNLIALFPSEPKECNEQCCAVHDGIVKELKTELSSLKARMEVGEIEKVMNDVLHKHGVPGYVYSLMGYCASAIVKHLKGEKI